MPYSLNQVCPAGRYRVQPGDTLWKIAFYNQTTVDTLLRFNPGVQPYKLQVGTMICLPAPVPIGPGGKCETGRYWTVAPGESFYLISMMLGISVEVLLQLNPFVDIDNIPIGTNLCLPAPPI